MSVKDYTPIIGIEVHVELRMNTKMFCGCPADHFGIEPNTHTCPVCLGLPGALPVANQEGIRRTVKIGLALGSEIATHSKFDRKNYFYPDLPKGYQISQYDQPLCSGGVLETELGPVRITRVHLEEDTAKLQHVTLSPDQMKQAGVEHADVSLLDFNRSGVGLVEIVTEPDIHSPEHAKQYGKELVQLLRYLDVSDCDMEKGSLRLEANISVQNAAERAAGQLPDYKVEVKNLNSFRYLERAIAYEIDRQAQLRDAGETPAQETRGWNDAAGVTYSQRSKETAEDYRYFPDPDLAPLELDMAWVDAIRAELPELPAQARVRLRDAYGLHDQNASVLVSDRVTAMVADQLLTAAVSAQLDPQQVANQVVNKKVDTWLLNDVPQRADTNAVIDEIARVLEAVKASLQTESIDDDALYGIIDSILSTPEGMDALEKYRAGKTQVLGFILGQVMRQAGKKLDARSVTDVVRSELDKRK